MASSGSADEDFQSRVARIFGSLAFSRSSPSTISTASTPAPKQQSSSSAWSLSDSELEKREWKRDSYDREDTPCASSFDEILKQQRKQNTDGKSLVNDLEDLEDLEDDKTDGANEVLDDDWSMRASIGLDRTLDHEEEEDEFDKVALGEESVAEGLSILNKKLSKSSCGRIRDPRANYLAAKIRLKEDEFEAKKFSVSSTSKERPKSEESTKVVPPPKPILKRKENSSDSEARKSKRVRFNVGAEETSKKPQDVCSESSGKVDPRVPDYLQNPSKYTCYSFGESTEKSSTPEDMDIPKAVEGITTSESEPLEKVAFIPKKKTKDLKEDGSNCSEMKPTVAGQVDEDVKPSATEDEDTEIEESESGTSIQRNGRQYRAKQSLDETDV